ncbi:MAG: UDP-N-acetylmuramoyl-L-alanine--D-glutamate ligase [Sphingomonadaceae bacterium]|nr:UDP-N-acetylmuramoyl-L-alanine--D-glutamate ligase [Sphingomonadaceae bacterium]
MITSETWRGKRYAVLGLARSGGATVDTLLASGAEVVAWDADEAARDALKAPPLQGRGLGWELSTRPEVLVPADIPHHNPSPEGEGLLTFADPLTLDLTGFAGVVVSPGVPINRHPIAAHAKAAGALLIGDIELFAQARAELPPHKVVGITGTNGKSTTTALVHHMLKTAGVPTTMGGNIGLPILGQKPLPEGGVYVLELSSYQIDLTYTLDCDVAVLLNVTPDHLDRYDGFEAYAASKARLFEMQSSGNPFVINPEDECARRISKGITTKRHALPNWTTPNDEWEWQSLRGRHNLQNACAAIQVARLLGVSDGQIALALESFSGLPHRMERVRVRNGVPYVNDSKATNPTSTAPALAAYPAVHWILGGRAKSDDLDACAPHFDHVRAAYTIGEAGPMFARLLAPHMPVDECGVLDAAVSHAAAAARPGETVLLSPACASFDQFRDYEARGDAFRALVEAL